MGVGGRTPCPLESQSTGAAGHRSRVRPGSALCGVTLATVEMPDHRGSKKRHETRRVPTAARVGREHRCLKARNSGRTRLVRVENTPLGGRATQRDREPRPQDSSQDGESARDTLPPRPRRSRGAVGGGQPLRRAAASLYFLPLYRVGSPPGPNHRQR